MRRPESTAALASTACLSVLLPACASRVVALEPPQLPPLSAAPSATSVEVIGSLAGGSDPLPVRGAHVSFGGLTRAVEYSVMSAARPWAERHRSAHPSGWRILVAIVCADAEA